MDIFGFDISITWILIVGFVVLFYLYGKRRNQYFKNTGIPGPPPAIYIGHLARLIKMGVTFDNPDEKTYGKVYGIFIGGIPTVVVTDDDIIREIVIKNFKTFVNRQIMDLDDFPIDKGLFFERGETWRRVRHITSPAFSGSKLRLMCGRINQCAERLTGNLITAAETNTDVKIRDYFAGYTLDVIASTAFGTDTGSQSELNSRFMTEAKKVFGEVNKPNPLTLLAVIFPVLVPLLKSLGVGMFPSKSLKFFHDIFKQMIEERKSDAAKGVKHTDFLQALIDCEAEESDTASSSKESKKMTADEIMGQALSFFVAGYDTTANTLHFAAYSLATNPEVQQKLIDEIDDVLGNAEPTYDNIKDLTYTDHVITETLRLYPVIPTLNREVSETITIKGFTFPRGVGVMFPLLNIHRDPKRYPEPNTFKPERWDQKFEMEQLNYLPFGHGPRSCIGNRLAQVTMKIGLARVLQKVRFVPADDTPVTLTEKDLQVAATMDAKTPIQLKLERR